LFLCFTFTSRILMGVSGGTSIAFQLFFYKAIVNHFGLVLTYRAGLFLVPLFNCMFPLCHLFYGNSVAMWFALISVFCLQTCANQCVFSSVFALISNSCYRDRMGQVNGVSQSLVALMRAVAPITAGWLFAWSIEQDHSFPFDVWFNFLLQLVFHMCILGSSVLFSTSLNKPKNEQIELSVDGENDINDKGND
jgi:MFS family permease